MYAKEKRYMQKSFSTEMTRSKYFSRGFFCFFYKEDECQLKRLDV